MGLVKLSPQALFNKACRGVIRQGRPALENGRCRYRTEDGLKCAIGYCIPNKDYQPSMEGESARGMADRLGICYPQSSIMEKLQAAHDLADESNFVEDFKERARSIARTFNLNTEVLD